MWGLLSLERVQMEDVSEIYELIDKNRNYLRNWLNWVDGIQSASQERDEIRSILSDSQGLCFVVKNGSDDKIIGMINAFDVDSRAEECQVSFWIAEDYCNKGYGADALTQFEQYATEEGIKTIVIKCDDNNGSAISVAQKCNYKQCEDEGTTNSVNMWATGQTVFKKDLP